MKNAKLVICGNGDWASLMARYFDADSSYDVVAFCADKTHLKEAELDGRPVIAWEDVQASHPAATHDLFVAVGYTNMRERKRMYDAAKATGYRLANFVSPHAILDSTNRMGDNNVVLHGAVLEPFAVMGDNNVVCTNAVLCHHAVLGNHNFFAAQSCIGGYSTVEDLCFFGFKATAAHKLAVGDETVLGAHSLLLQSADGHGTYVGVPAVRKHIHGENGRTIA